MAGGYTADSVQLRQLRLTYCSAHPIRATGMRLGYFAVMRGIKIDDFGAHSQRWVRQFKTGAKDAQRHLSLQPKIVKG